MTTPTTVNVRIQLRADTAANWTAANPILLANEAGFETDTKQYKLGDGTTAWNSLAYFPSIVSGGTVTGNLEIGSTGTLTFEGATVDDYETTLGVIDPTADRVINLPDQSGTVIVTGNASIVDADIAANAEIAVSKLANGTANQVLVTDGTDVSWSDNLTLAGDLTVNGTTTTVNSETLLVKDKNIEMGVVDTPTDSTADGGGITLKGATDKTINWIDATDAWTSSERFSVPLGSAASPSLTFTGDENSGLYSPGADQVAVATNGTGRLFVDENGTTALVSNLAINGGELGSRSANITDSTSNDALIYGSNTGSLNLQGGASQPGAGIRITGRSRGTDPATIQFFTEGTSNSLSSFERLRITSAGLVGIGTGTPSDILTVKQAVNGDNQITIYNDDTTSGSALQTNSISFDFARTGSSALQRSAAIILAGKEGEWTSSSASQDGYLAFYTTINATNTTEKVRITSGGNVGIGTTSPGAKLHVSSGASSAVISSNADDLTVENSDNCGITIATPNTSTGTIRFADPQRSNSGGIYYDHNVDSLSFVVNAAESARIDSDGRLLVGTSTNIRGSKLQVLSTGNDHQSLVGGNQIAQIELCRSSNSAGGAGLIADGNVIARIECLGNDGSAYRSAARIEAVVDGTPGASDMPGRLVFSTTADGASSPTERMRIDSTGKVRFFTGATEYGSMQKKPDATNRLVVSSHANAGYLGIAGNVYFYWTATSLGPSADNVYSLGVSGARYSVVYAGTGTINTSDATLKQDIANLDAAELSVATAIKGLIKKFRFIDAVAEKGGDARIHVGVVAQEVEQAFVNEGLDPRRYGMFCEDTLEDGSKRLGIRYDELLAFVIAAL